jgi:UDP-N-acetylmuramoyl-tripeptide--D-alanyl-D-alanine ligase
MTWTLADVLDATGGVLAAGTRRQIIFDSVSTDSRRLDPGALFVALTGPNHDGHRFVTEALARGARAVVVREVPAGVPRECAILVSDPLTALQDLAAWTRRRINPLVVGVTGSNGKTTTKEMIAAICERAEFALPRAAVLKTLGTENNLIGVPATLLRLTGNEAVAVLEMGMNAPGEIARLVEIAAPDVGVITNVGPAHLAGVGGNIEGVAAAKKEMFDVIGPDATMAINIGDEWIMRIAADFRGRRVTFGRGGDVEANAVADLGLQGVGFDLNVAGRHTKVRLRLPGAHNVANALAAAAVAYALGVDPDATRAGLESATAPPKRMQVTRLANHTTLLNDSYNANPANVEAALRVLAHQPGRRVAVLGEMLELGAQSAALHRRIGFLAARHGVQLLVAVGAQAEAIAAGAREGGMALSALHVCADPAAAAALVAAEWRAGDTVLVKGSRGLATEELVRLRGSRMAEVVRLLEEASGRP